MDDHNVGEGDPEAGSTTPEERRARARRVRIQCAPYLK
jgi:hypothetical protein